MKKSFIIFLLVISISSVIAQNKANNVWFFGSFIGLNFNTSPPTFFTNMAFDVFEGCATRCSSTTGQILFYTDGKKVYNKNNNIMPNSIITNLVGDVSSSQSSVIVPYPGDTNKYYIFNAPPTAEGQCPSWRMCYTIVDMTLNAGLGDIININTPLFDTSCEKSAAIGNCDGSIYWVVGKQWSTNKFYAYKITSAGLDTTPVISSAGLVHNANNTGGFRWASAGYMKFSPNGKKLGLAAYTYLDFCEIFDFDFNTGIISNGLVNYIPSLPVFLNGPYGCSFSPNSTKFYVATQGSFGVNGEIWQFDATASTNAAFNASKTLLASIPNCGFGAIQNGPDNNMYVALSANSFLGVINNPNDNIPIATYNHNAISLGNESCNWGLPNLIENFQDIPFAPIIINDTTICKGDTIVYNYDKTVPITIYPATNITYSTDSSKIYFYPISTVTYSIISYGGCNKVDTNNFTITIAPAPIVNFNFSPVSPTLANAQITLTNNTANTGTLAWYYNNSIVGTNSTYLFNNPGIGTYCFSLVVNNSIGCQGTDTACITILDTTETAIYIPNSFSPNNDGLNDQFAIIGKNFTLKNFAIYNRLGEVVFTTTNRLIGWNGKFNNIDCDMGVYYYTVTYIDAKGKVEALQGDVTLFK
jgi:gliding motility-associated-like protein